MQNIHRGFRRLFDFSGRDRGDQFWPYAITIFALVMAGGMAIFLPAFAQTMARMQDFATAHPDQATVTSGGGSYSITITGSHPELLPNFGAIIRGMGFVIAVGVLFWAAAVTRRLHDRGRTGFWGLLPLPFLAFSFFAMAKLFDSFGKTPIVDTLFFPVFFSNLLYMIGLVCLIVLLCGSSTPGANRYGDIEK